VSELTPAVVKEMISAGQRMTSPFSAILCHHFHGAPTRISLPATAFGLRTEHFMMEIIAAWVPGDGRDSLHRKWARHTSQNLAPYAFPGGYANMLGPDEREQIIAGYGANFARLQQAKKRFDPDNIFSSAIPLFTGN
jgi:FAD/FMN-containing dehydrogenase